MGEGRLGKWISLQVFFSLEVDFFASSQWEGDVALGGTGILSFSDSHLFCEPADQVQCYFSCENQYWQYRAWDQTGLSCTPIFAGFDEQIVLLDGIWQAFFTSMSKHSTRANGRKGRVSWCLFFFFFLQRQELQRQECDPILQAASKVIVNAWCAS